MLQVIVPLPERTANGAKLDSRLINTIESDFLNSVGGFSVTHGQRNDGIKQHATRFYSFEIEQHDLGDLRASIYRARRALGLNESVTMGVTELNTITVN